MCKYGKYKSSGDEIGYFICRKCSQGCFSEKAFKVAASKKQAADIYLLKKVEIGMKLKVFTSVNSESFIRCTMVLGFLRWTAVEKKQAADIYLLTNGNVSSCKTLWGNVIQSLGHVVFFAAFTILET